MTFKTQSPRRVLPAMVVLFCLAGVGRAEGLKLMANEQDRLLRGEVLTNFKTVEDSKINLVQGQILYDARPDLVWAILIDYKSYPRFFTDMNQVQILEQNGSARVHIRTRNLWPYPDFDYIMRIVPTLSSLTMSWRMEQGNLKTLYGTCKLFPFPGKPQKTVAVYSLVQDPGWMVPKLSSEMGNRSLVVERLLGVRQELRTRAKANGTPPPEIRPQWRKALFWWEREEPDPTIDELFNPPFAEPGPKPSVKP